MLKSNILETYKCFIGNQATTQMNENKTNGKKYREFKQPKYSYRRIKVAKRVNDIDFPCQRW